MSTTIDERVVEMRFDNRHFESNVSTTMSSLDKLKQSLNLTGATKGLEGVGAAAKKVDMMPLADSVQTVGLKFNWLHTYADQTMRRITDSVNRAAKNIASALTIDPIKTGFSEYETKINSIQTIMSNTASKGTTMEDVTRVIGELNTYADKTIYNFAEMTRNIGTFTAAGVGLEESAAAIQGIANLAAASGSSSQQASTAMYQLSQALSTGTVRLMDWNSVVNAGMGGEKFQEALKATAREHGVAVDDIIKKNGSFRDSLQDGWLSADILNETLNKFTVDGAKKYADSMVKSGKYTQEQADALIKEAQAMEDAATKVKTFTQLWDTLKESAQSGWSQTWEILVGDFEEAKELLTQVSDVIGGMISASAESRNALLEDWKLMGGRAELIEALKNAFEAIMAVVKPIKEAFRDIFPPTTAKQLFDFTVKLKEFTANLKLGYSASEDLKRTFRGLFAVLNIVKKVVGALFKGIAPLFGAVGDLGGGILGLTGSFGDWLVRVDEGLTKMGVFDMLASGITKTLKFLINVVKTVAKFIKESFVTGPLQVFSAFIDGFKSKFDEMGQNAENLGEALSGAFESAGSAIANCALFKVLKGMWTILATIVKLVGKVVGTLVGGLVDKLANADFEGILNFLSTLSVGAIAAGIIKFVKNMKNITGIFGDFKEAGLEFMEGITGILDQVRDAIAAWQTSIKADAIMKIAKAVALLVAAIVVLSFVDPEKLSSAVSALALVFGELLIGLNLISKIQNPITGVAKTAGAMLSISAAVLLLAIALKKISSLKPEELAMGLLSIATLMVIVVAAVKQLAVSDKSTHVMKGAMHMVILAAAIAILAKVCKTLAKFSWEELAKGVGGVSVLVLALSGAAKLMTTSKDNKTKGAMQMVAMALMLVILGSVLKKIGAMKWEAIAKGLTGILGVMTILVGAVAIMSLLNDKKKMTTEGANQIIKLSAALVIVSVALKQVGSMSWTAIAKGLVGITGTLAVLVGVLAIMTKLSSTKNMDKSGPTQLLKMAATLVVIGLALKQVGSMSWTAIGKGLTGLTVALVAMVAAIAIMSALKGKAVGGAAAILVMALALGVLTPVLLILGSMSWESIAKGLTTLAGAFVIIGAAALLLSPVIGTVTALAGAVALIGVGILAAGVGLVAFGLGLTAVSAGLVAFAGAAVVAAKAIPAIAQLIAGVISAIVVGFLDGIIASASKLGEAVKILISTLMSVLVDNIPTIVDGLLKLVVALLQSLADYTPQIVTLLVDIFVNVLNALAEAMGPLAQAFSKVANAFVKGIVDALAGIDGGNLDVAFIAAGKLGLIMASLAAAALLAPAALAGIAMMVPVIAGLSVALSAIGALAQIPGLQWLIGEGGNLLQVVGTAIGKFVGGIVGGFMGGVSAQFPQIAEDLSNFMTKVQPFIEGAKKIDASVVTGVGSLVAAILLVTGASLLEKITSWITGESSISSFAEELVNLGNGIKGFSDAVAGVNPENVTAAANAAKALAEMTNCIPNSGGILSWFSGDNSIASFANELPKLGAGLKGFSDKIAGIAPENMIAASNAAKSLADMTNNIPNSGGIAAWFSGENSVSKFSTDLVKLGAGLKGFSDKITGINTENIVAASNAAKNIAEMVSHIPSEGGIKAWFAGESSVSKFSLELIMLGMGLKGFADKVNGINPENVTAAATAAKNLAEMTSVIPTEGGIKAWFTGESSISKFANKLPKLGEGLKGFSDKVAGINPENVSAASKAAKTLAQMADDAPSDLEPMVNFGKKLKPFGEKLKGYFDQTAKITGESIAASKNAINAVKNITGINSGNIEAASKAITKLTKSLKETSSIKASTTDGFVKAISNLGKISVEKFTKSFEKLDSQMNKIGKNAVGEFVKAVNAKKNDVNEAGKSLSDALAKGITTNNKTISTAFTTLITGTVTTIRGNYKNMYSAGSYLVSGLSAGISANAPTAISRAQALASSVATIMRKVLKINSPSKVGYEIGDFYGLGFVNAIGDYESIAYKASSGMADSAKTGLSDAISKIQRFIDNDIDSQPTIRPVLDLSDVESNAGRISRLLDGTSVVAMSNIGAISSMMGQNGRSSGNDDVVSALEKLRKDLGNMKSETYQINGVTYDDGSNIAEAVKALIRAARIEGRV